MTYEARSFFQFLLNLTFLLNELNDEMLTNLKPVVLENEDLEEKNFEGNDPSENLQGKVRSTFEFQIWNSSQISYTFDQI